MVKLFKAFRSFRLYIQCTRAIKKAKRKAVVTGRKQLVLMYGKKPVVISKTNLQKMIKGGYFSKGFTIQQAESLAIFKTQ